jgi:cellulose biosynthesis protein BcsQ
MALPVHFDEARHAAVKALTAFVEAEPRVQQAVLLDDLFGRIRVIVWVGSDAQKDEVRPPLAAALSAAVGQPYWTGEIWARSPETSKSDDVVYARAWQQGRAVDSAGKVRLSDQVRSRLSWLAGPRDPPWDAATATHQGARIVAFHSFKGGVGRSTALAAFAIRRARAGERVVVLDLDFDAPGVGTLLAADAAGTIAPWGICDYLIERPHSPVQLADYFHTCAREGVTGSGAIHCFPAGQLNDDYLTKVARLDLEAAPETRILEPLLEDVRVELKPDWILLDARAGLSPVAGMLLSGLAHTYVLFATAAGQSWPGLRRVLHRLGAERLLVGSKQADCILVQALVPESADVASDARAEFAARAEQEFEDHYYAESADEPADDVWSVDDIDSSDAPHVAVPLSYTVKLAFFRDVLDVAEYLVSSDEYGELERRIQGRFPMPEDQWQA